MSVLAVKRAVSLIAESVATLPLKTYDGDTREAARDHPNKLEAETMKKLAVSWFQSHGKENSGSTAILDEGMTYQQVAAQLADAEFSEVRREQVREIARAFNVPPALLYELSRGTWSNFEQSHRDFLTGTLRPWISRWQAAHARDLLTPVPSNVPSIPPSSTSPTARSRRLPPATIRSRDVQWEGGG